MATRSWIPVTESLHRAIVKPAFRAVIAGSMLATSLTAALPSFASAQDAGATLAAYTPETTLMYADVNLDQQSDQWAKANELAERSGVLNLLGEDEQTQVQEELGQFGSILDGDAAFVLTSLPTNVDISSMGGDMTNAASDPASVASGDIADGWSAIFRPSDPSTLYDMILSDPVGTVEEIEYNGYTITTVTPEDDYSTPQAVALVDDVVVVATNADDIEPIIDAKAGETANLAENDGYLGVRGELNAETLASGFINGTALLAAVDEQDPALTEQVPAETLAMINGTAGFAFWADDPGFRVDVVAKPGEGSSFVAAAPSEATFPTKVEDSSVVYVGGTDLGANPVLSSVALVSAQELIGTPAGATPVADQDPEAYADSVFAEAESTLGFNLKTDFLDNLNGEWGLTGSITDLDSAAPTISGVFASGSDDPATLTTVADQVSELITQSEESIGGTVSTRDVEGATITVIDVSDESGVPFVIEFGVVNDQLMVGINSGIDAYLSEPEASLADSEAYSSTMSELPAEYSNVFFVNVPVVESLYNDYSATYAVTTTSDIEDADPSCGEFDSQEEAQAAYDEDNFENYLLDQNYDGEACEDFFAASTPAASPEVDADLDINVLGVGTVSSMTEDGATSNTIVRIGD